MKLLLPRRLAGAWPAGAFLAAFVLTLVLADVGAGYVIGHLAWFPDYATWTGIVPLEQKIRLLREFARQGPVDALILSSSIGDHGLSAEFLSTELSREYGRPFRVFNFSTGGAEAPLYPVLYRLARLVAKPRQVWVAAPDEQNIGDEVSKASPEYTLMRAPVGAALRHPALLPLSFTFFDMALVRMAGPARDAVTHGRLVNRPPTYTDVYYVDRFGDTISYSYYPDKAALLLWADRRRALVLDLARRYSAAPDERTRRAVYLSESHLKGIHELRDLTAEDKCSITVIAHDQSVGLMAQDGAYTAASEVFYREMSQVYGAPVINVCPLFHPESYAFSDPVHLNQVGALGFSALVAAKFTGKPAPEEVYAASPQLRNLAPDPKVTPLTAIILHHRSDPSQTLELQYLQTPALAKLPASSPVRILLKLPDQSTAILPARAVGGGRVVADASGIRSGDEVFAMQVVDGRGGWGGGMAAALASYRWSKTMRPARFYREDLAELSTEASYSADAPIHARWKNVDQPAVHDWIGVFPAGGSDQARLCFAWTGGGSHGTLELPALETAPPGRYELRMFRNGGWDLIAVSNEFVLAGSVVALTVSQASTAPGQPIHVEWSGRAAPKKDDWIGLFPKGGADSARLDFRFTGGQSSGALDLPVRVGLPKGDYEVRFYAAGGWDRMAVSTPFEIAAPSVRLEAGARLARAGESITASWSGMEPAAKDDWIGLFAKDDEAKKLSSQLTGGTPSGHVTFLIPPSVASGEYQFRLYARNTWQLVQVSKPFQIKGINAHIEVLPSQPQPGATVVIRWAGIDFPLPQDWIGIFDGLDTQKKVGNFLTGGKKAGSMRWTVPGTATPGHYQVLFFTGNTWQTIAHAEMTIQPATAEGHSGAH